MSLENETSSTPCATGCSLASPPDIICEFCENPLCLQCVKENAYGSCCATCWQKAKDGVCGERGESLVMAEVVKMLTEYGDASFDCGEHSGDGYEDVNERRKAARKRLLQFVASHIQD
jgi:hypothetical protein